MSRAAALLLVSCAGWCGEALAATAAEPVAADERSSAERVDDAHATQADYFGRLFEQVDRLFGEQYVEDRDRKIEVRVGGKTTLNDEGTRNDTALTLALRFPLPAPGGPRLNPFLEIGEEVRELDAGSDQGRDEARTRISLAAGLLVRTPAELEGGFKVNVRWESGSFAAIYPFVRFERKRPPMRYFIEQRLVWESDNAWSSRTDIQLDCTVGAGMFLRLGNRFNYDFGEPGMQLAHGLILRQLAFSRTGLSFEVWLEYDSAGDDREEVGDDTIVYAQARLRGRLWRRWLEYELRPAYTVVLDSCRDAFYSFSLSLTVRWDSFLGGSSGHPAETYR